MVNPLCTGRNQMGCKVSEQEAPVINTREASEFEQAMAELNKSTDKKLKDMLLQKYGVTTVQLTEEELEACQ